MRLRSFVHHEPTGRHWGNPSDDSDNDPPGSRRAEASPLFASEQLSGQALEDGDGGLRSLQAMVLGRHRERAGSTSVFVMGSAEGAAAPSAAMRGVAAATTALGYRALLVDAATSHPSDPDDRPLAEGLVGAGSITHLPTLPLRKSVTPGVSELRLGEAFPDLVQAIEKGGVARQLRATCSKFDLVLIDAGIVDADWLAGLSAGSDGVVLFVGQHRTRLSAVETVLARLRTREAELLGIALA